MQKLVTLVIVLVSGWNGFLLAIVCRTFAGYIWNIESEPVKWLMVVPVGIFVCFASFAALSVAAELVRRWLNPSWPFTD